MGLDLAGIVCLQMRVPTRRKSQILRAFISRLMYSAWRRASATMVRVGFAAPAVVMVLPSEMNRFLTSCVWPQALVTPSRGSALKRIAKELEFMASYTFSKTFDDASDFDEQPQNPFDLRAENAVSRQHQQQRFGFNALWELPIGDEEEKGGKSEENTGWLTQAFSHIEVAPILTLESGRPVNPLTGLDSNQNHAFPLS